MKTIFPANGHKNLLTADVPESDSAKTAALYLHIPFFLYCCSYCDFYTVARLETAVPDYVAAVLAEIAPY